MARVGHEVAVALAKLPGVIIKFPFSSTYTYILYEVSRRSIVFTAGGRKHYLLGVN